MKALRKAFLAAGVLLVCGMSVWAQDAGQTQPQSQSSDSGKLFSKWRWQPARKQSASDTQNSSSNQGSVTSGTVSWVAEDPHAKAPAKPAATTGTVSWVAEDPRAKAPARPMTPAHSAHAPIQPVALQQPVEKRPAVQLPPGLALDESQEYHIRLTPPGPDTLFRRETETQLQERMRQEALSRTNPERVEFPKESAYLTKAPYTPRNFPAMNEQVEPSYVCYQRLGFEQKNFERQGWDLGFITPFVSAMVFFKDVALIPYHLGTEPCRAYECNRGYCLPGTPTPLLLYPPELSVLGTFFEAGTIAGIFLVFPA